MAKMEAEWDISQEENEFYMGVEDAIQQLIISTYDSCWLKEIEDDVLNFTHKIEFDMLKHLLSMSQADKLQEAGRTNKHGIPLACQRGLRNIFFQAQKGANKTKNMDVIWYNTKKFIQGVERIYNSDMFDEQQLMEW